MVKQIRALLHAALLCELVGMKNRYWLNAGACHRPTCFAMRRRDDAGSKCHNDFMEGGSRALFRRTPIPLSNRKSCETMRRAQILLIRLYQCIPLNPRRGLSFQPGLLLHLQDIIRHGTAKAWSMCKGRVMVDRERSVTAGADGIATCSVLQKVQVPS